MDIQLAKQTLEAVINSRTTELNALQTALDLLENTFQADFINLQLAQKEANDLSAQLQAEKLKNAD